MKTRMTILVILAASGLSLTLAIRGAGQETAKLAPAQVPISDPCPSCAQWLLGITRQQTARLSAFNPNAPGMEPVHLEFIWFDSAGNVLAESVQSVEGGHAVSSDLNGARRSGFEPNRIQILGEVRLLDLPPARVVVSLEVFDNAGIDAGKTRLYEDITFPRGR